MRVNLEFNVNDMPDCPPYPDNPAEYDNWLNDLEVFAREDCVQFVKNKFPNLREVNLEDFEDYEFVHIYAEL